MADSCNYERELGGINAKLEIVLVQQDKIFKQQDETLKGIGLLSSNGCALGKRNSKDIEDLQRRPERLIGIGSSVVAVVAALIAWFKSGV